MGKENVKGEEEAAKEKQRVCKRCKETYSASSNTPTSCRYHPSFLVCRRHDDQRRYYELGPDTLPMLPSSMIVVERRMRRHLAVLLASIFHMMTNK